MMAFAAQLVPSTFLRVLSSTSFETFATERDPTNLLVACGLAKLVCFPVREKGSVALVVVGKVLSRDCLKTCDASDIFRTDKVRTRRNKAIQRVISGILAKQDRTKSAFRYFDKSVGTVSQLMAVFSTILRAALDTIKARKKVNADAIAQFLKSFKLSSPGTTDFKAKTIELLNDMSESTDADFEYRCELLYKYRRAFPRSLFAIVNYPRGRVIGWDVRFSNFKLEESDQVECDQVECDQVERDQVECDQVESDQVESDQVESDQVESESEQEAKSDFKRKRNSKHSSAHVVSKRRKTSDRVRIIGRKFRARRKKIDGKGYQPRVYYELSSAPGQWTEQDDLIVKQPNFIQLRDEFNNTNILQISNHYTIRGHRYYKCGMEKESPQASGEWLDENGFAEARKIYDAEIQPQKQPRNKSK